MKSNYCKVDGSTKILEYVQNYTIEVPQYFELVLKSTQINNLY